MCSRILNFLLLKGNMTHSALYNHSHPTPQYVGPDFIIKCINFSEVKCINVSTKQDNLKTRNSFLFTAKCNEVKFHLKWVRNSWFSESLDSGLWIRDCRPLSNKIQVNESLELRREEIGQAFLKWSQARSRDLLWGLAGKPQTSFPWPPRAHMFFVLKQREDLTYRAVSIYSQPPLRTPLPSFTCCFSWTASRTHGLSGHVFTVENSIFRTGCL